MQDWKVRVFVLNFLAWSFGQARVLYWWGQYSTTYRWRNHRYMERFNCFYTTLKITSEFFGASVTNSCPCQYWLHSPLITVDQSTYLNNPQCFEIIFQDYLIKQYATFKSPLLKGINGEYYTVELNYMKVPYNDDINFDSLKAQLQVLRQILKDKGAMECFDNVLCEALMRDDISWENFTTKPRFENANGRFYRGQILKTAKKKRIPSWKQHEGAGGLRKFHTSEAWWSILCVWRNHA